MNTQHVKDITLHARVAYALASLVLAVVFVIFVIAAGEETCFGPRGAIELASLYGPLMFLGPYGAGVGVVMTAIGGFGRKRGTAFNAAITALAIAAYVVLAIHGPLYPVEHCGPQV